LIFLLDEILCKRRQAADYQHSHGQQTAKAEFYQGISMFEADKWLSAFREVFGHVGDSLEASE
jgi:hypothetical protein